MISSGIRLGSLHARRLAGGFTMTELMVTLVIFALMVGAAISNLSGMVNTRKAEGAADAFVRAVATARAVAAQTGSRTVLVLNGSSTTLDTVNVTDNCGATAVWAVITWTTSSGSRVPKVMNCVSAADFKARYGNAGYSITSSTITYLPTGIATNASAVSATFTSGGKSTVVNIAPGGIASVGS